MLRSAIHSAWMLGASPTVAIIGDSNVARFRLGRRYLNLGVSHNTSQDFAVRITDDLAQPAAAGVSHVVLWGPTNDIHYWNGFGARYLRDAGMIAASDNRRVILCTVCPHIDQSQPKRGRSHGEVSVGIRTLNTQIRELAKAQGWPIADLHALMVDCTGELRREFFIPEDGPPDTYLHLSRTGIRVAMRAIGEQI